MEKDTADRSFYAGVEKNNLPNQGAEFGIERAEFAYTFAKPLELSTGWDIRALDIKSGGLVFGDDHPFIGAKGQLAENTGYELLYLMIQNRDTINVADSPIKGDWRAYSVKLDQAIPFGANKLKVSPFAAASNNKDKEANAYYFGAEATGNLGIITPVGRVRLRDRQLRERQGHRVVRRLPRRRGGRREGIQPLRGDPVHEG